MAGWLCGNKVLRPRVTVDARYDASDSAPPNPNPKVGVSGSTPDKPNPSHKP